MESDDGWTWRFGRAGWWTEGGCKRGIPTASMYLPFLRVDYTTCYFLDGGRGNQGIGGYS